MADKDKIKGWFLSPHKWWGLRVSISLKFLRWLGKFPRWLVFTEMGWFVVIEVIVVIVLICFFGSKEAEFARLLITGMIAVGGGYSLILAARRAVKFSEQVDTAQKQVEIGQNQLFNEQLGRAAELLANEKMAIRQAGVRVLADLAEKTPDQVKLIMQIIYDFVAADALSSAMPRERLDIALGIKTLGFLYNKSGQKVELKKLVAFTGYHLKGLDLSDAQLQGVRFFAVKLQGAQFSNAQLQRTDFNGAQLQGAYFYDAQLQRTDFKGANLQWVDCMGADFSNAENLTKNQVKGMIFKVDAPPKLPDDLEQFLDKRCGYEWKENPNNVSDLNCYFVDSDAEWSGRAIHDWVDKYLASIRGPEDA